MNELEITNGNKNLIVCFGGFFAGGMMMPFMKNLNTPFEFHNLLSSYINVCDLLFYKDRDCTCYHNGIVGITNNIEETVAYLNGKIAKGNYEKVVFMGSSGGGYAAVLFGSLCNNVTNVISFAGPTQLMNSKFKEYRDLKPIINETTQYTLFANTAIQKTKDPHHVSHCENIGEFPNVTIIKKNDFNLKSMRDSGEIKSTINNILSPS
jgi:hypothetical protein